MGWGSAGGSKSSTLFRRFLGSAQLSLQEQRSRMSVERWWNDADGGNSSTGRKTWHSVTVSTVSLTWTELGSNPGLGAEGPVPCHGQCAGYAACCHPRTAHST